VVAYFPSLKQSFFAIGAAMRKDGQALLKTKDMSHKAGESWIGFLSNDVEDAGDSVYCGRVAL
jgi:hypothetical protein